MERVSLTRFAVLISNKRRYSEKGDIYWFADKNSQRNTRCGSYNVMAVF